MSQGVTDMLCQQCGGELPPGRRKFCTDRCSDTHRQSARRARDRAYSEAVAELRRQGGTERTAISDDTLLHQFLWVHNREWPDKPTEAQLQAGFMLAVGDFFELIRASSTPELFRRGQRTDKLRRRVLDRAARRALQRIDEFRVHVDLDDLEP